MRIKMKQRTVPCFYRIGLVNRVVPADKLIEEAEAMAKIIVEKGRFAVKQAKKATGTDGNFELESKFFGKCFETEEQKKKMKEFLEKHKSK